MKIVKATLRIPTDMYAYIEVAVEGTPEEIVKQYFEFKKLYEDTKLIEVTNSEVFERKPDSGFMTRKKITE